jgi:hypothetical protein
MSIISIPSNIVKGQPATITLFKGELLSNQVVASNFYFSNLNNWNKVVLNYKSTVGNQKAIVEFSKNDNFAPATFLVSEKARDVFELDSIYITDNDGQILVVPSTSFTASQFTIDMTEETNEENNPESDGFVLLLEDGNTFLLESGDYLLLE